MTINHGSIKKCGMDSMTTAFRAGDPAMVKAVKLGDKIQLVTDRINGGSP